MKDIEEPADEIGYSAEDQEELRLMGHLRLIGHLDSRDLGIIDLDD